MDDNKKSDAQSISRPFAPLTLANKVQMPTPRTFNGHSTDCQKVNLPTPPQLPPLPLIKNGQRFYTTDKVARILGVDKKTVRNWREQKIFVHDDTSHTGAFLYAIERVEQLASVYHKDWIWGGYEPSPTCTGLLTADDFDAEYLRLIKLDIAQAQAHLDELPETDRRGLTLPTLRHFHCGYLPDWVLTKSRAELACGLYINEDTGENKHLPPPSPRIIIPTAGNLHFNAVATSSVRQSMDKRFWKQHAGKMTLFFDTDKNLDSDTIFIVEGEFDAMSIWQASAGKIAVAAILGCDNWKRTLLPKLPDLRGKHLILLLDADAAGNKAAKRLLNELLQRGIPAVRKSLFDALRKDEQNYFGRKVDANDLLKARGDEYLNQLLVKIIDSSSYDFNTLTGKINQPNPFADGSDPDIPVSPTRKSARQFSTIKPSDDRDEIRLILENFVHAKNLSRDEWCSVGMILKRYGFEFADFDAWSRDDARYNANDCKTQWDSFKTADELGNDGYTIATLIDLAKKFGYKPKNIYRRDTSDTLDTDFNGEQYIRGLTEDLDNARRLATFCCERVKWLTDTEHWLIWNKKGLWQRCSDKNSCLAPEVSRLADLMMNHSIHLAKEARRLEEEYLKISTETVDNITRIKTDGDPAIKQARDKSAKADEKKDKAFAVAYDFRRAKKISSAITMMKGESSILITSDDLDKHKNLLNCLNGVVDLENGKLYPHNSSLLITQQCRAAYFPNAYSKLVNNFFLAIQPDEMTRAGLLRWLGYCLTGEVKEEKFMIHTGNGGNGKGVLSATVLELLDSYGIGLAPTALLKSNRPYDPDKATTALNGLELARCAISEEMPADGELEMSLIKNLSGGDRINLRRLHAEYRTITPTVKLNLSGNYTPKIENVHDDGLLRRMLNMPYLVKFGTLEHPADCNLKKKMFLPENLNALLALLVSEAQAWYRDGLIISPLMKQETKRHLEQNDFISDFISDNYVRGNNLWVKAKDFVDDLRHEYPRECSRFKRADLIKLVANTSGVTYILDRTKTRVFKGIGKLGAPSQQDMNFDGEPVKDELPPFDEDDLPI
ncbi:MAG: PriCT-2 domain-containing protein [Selenomonadaceae bacterium]|nr:PriCT-2 domain-containing protein [Selenomonadaceae bacterium]